MFEIDAKKARLDTHREALKAGVAQTALLSSCLRPLKEKESKNGTMVKESRHDAINKCIKGCKKEGLWDSRGDKMDEIIEKTKAANPA